VGQDVQKGKRVLIIKMEIKKYQKKSLDWLLYNEILKSEMQEKMNLKKHLKKYWIEYLCMIVIIIFLILDYTLTKI
jgi:hypothetical protein